MEPDEKVDDDLDVPASGFPGVTEIIGLIAGLVPFFIHYSTWDTVEINGVTQSSRQTDFIALGGGALALLMALAAFVALKKTGAAARTKRLVTAVALVALGGFQLLRGLGVL